MSTSLLYHVFGVRGYRYVKTEYREGAVIFCDFAASGVLSMPSVWIPGGDRSRPERPPVSDRADRWQARVFAVARSSGGVSALRGGASGQDWLCRPSSQLYPSVRAICLGAVPPYDHQGRRGPFEHQLGCDPGDPEAEPQAAVWQAEAEATQADCHRRDFHGQGAPVRDDRDGPSERGSSSRRPGKRR